MATNNSNAVANLFINLGATTNIQQVTNAAKEFSKILDKEIYNDGKQRKGLTVNVETLKRGEKSIIALMDEIKKKGFELGSIGSDGNFLKDANGKTTALEKTFNKLKKQLVAVRKELDRLNPSALRSENALRRAKLASDRITDSENSRRARREKIIAQNVSGHPEDYFNKSASASGQVFMSKEGMLYESRNLARIDREKKAITELAGYDAKRTAELRKQKDELRKQDLELQKQTQTTQKRTTQHGQLGQMARQYFNLWAVKAYAENLVKISAEFNMQRRALGVLINDQGKAVAMFNEIKSMALESPLTALELTKGVKQLSAFDIATKDLMKDIKMLGDISAGTGADLSRLILSYGHTNATRNLNSIELRQFAFAGVPLLANLAKKYTADEGRDVTPGEVRKRIEKRDVSFEDVREVLSAMTEEGGKFYNMQQQLAETTYGKIQKLKDAWLQGWAAMGDSNQGVINTILDGLVKIAKNVSMWAKSLGYVIIAYKTVGAVQKLNTLHINKQLKAVDKLQKLTNDREFYTTGNGKNLRNAKTMIAYYDKQIAQTTKMARGWQYVGAKIDRAKLSLERAKVSAQGFSGQIDIARKRVNVLATTIKYSVVNIGASIGRLFTANAPMLIITALTSIVSMLVNASQQAKQLKRDLAEIDAQTLNKNDLAEKRFSELANQAMRNEEGTRQREEALSKLNQLFGDVLPNEVLRIEYLKQLNGQYDILIERIKTYNKIKAAEDKQETLKGTEKYSKAISEGSIYYLSYLKGEEFTNQAVKTFLYKEEGENLREKINETLEEEVKAGLINTKEEYTLRAKELAGELGGEFGEEFKERLIVIMPAKLGEFFEKNKELEAYKILEQQKLYSEVGLNLINSQKEVNKIYQDQLNSLKTGNDLVKTRDEIQENTARNMAKALNTGKQQIISVSQAMAYLAGQMDADEILRLNHLKQGTEQYNQTLQTMTKMKEMFVGLFDGVNLFSEKSESILEMWKDQKLEIKQIRHLLGLGDDNSNSEKSFDEYLAENQKARKTLEKIVSQPENTLANYYGVKKSQVGALLKVNSKAAAAKFDTNIGNKNFQNLMSSYLTYYKKGYIDEDKKKTGGSGESALQRQMREYGEWIAMIDKARSSFKELGDYYSEDTAMEKTIKAYQQQFNNISEQFKKTTKMPDLQTLIKDNGNFTKGLQNIADYIKDVVLKQKLAPSDRKRVEEFLYNTILPKISQDNMGELKRHIDEFVKGLDRQLENARGRINIFEKIVGITGNESLAGKFAEALYGKGGLSEIGAVRKNFEDAVREFAKDIDFGVMLSEEAFDWKGVEDKILTLPSSLRDSLLKAFKELKSANEKSLEEALNSYKKQLSIEEQRVTAHNEMYRKMRAIDETYNLDEEGKRLAKDNVFKAYQKQMLDLELEEIRASDVYLQLFNNIEHAGVASLSALRMELIKLRDNAKDLSTKDLKSLNSEIKKIEDVLKPQKYTLGNALSLPSKKELTKKMTKLYAVQNEYNKKQAQLSEIAMEKDERQKRIKRAQSLNLPEDTYANNKAEWDALTQREQQITAETEALKEQINTLQMGIYDVESLHNKAIERMQSHLESYNQMLSNMANAGNSVVQVLQNIRTLSYKGKESTYLSHVASSISAGNSLTQGIIGIGQNGLNMFKSAKGNGLADVLAQRNEYKATIDSINAIAGEKTLEQTEQLSGAMSGLNANTGELVSTLGLMAIQLGVTVYDAMVKIHDQRLQDDIDEINDKIKEVDKNLRKIQNVMRKSTGNAVLSGMRKSIEEQKKQLEYTEQQLELAKQKKRKDDEEIKQYEDEAENRRQAIIDAENEMFEKLLGSSIDEYMKNLVKTFQEAAKSGQNTFKALKNSFSEMLSNMVQDTLMTTVIKNRMNNFFTQLEQISKRGAMGTADVDSIIATGLQDLQLVNMDLRAMQPMLNRINTAFGVNSSLAGSLAAGVKGMSEETAGTMAGYLMANFDRLGEIQKSVFAIQQSMGDTASGLMNQYQRDAITHLAQIEANTLRNANKLSEFYDMINSMKVVNTSGSGALYGIQTMN